MDDDQKAQSFILLAVAALVCLLFFGCCYPNYTPDEKKQFWADVAEGVADGLSDDD